MPAWILPGATGGNSRPLELCQFRLGRGHLILDGLQFLRIVHLLLRPGQLLAKRLEPQIERVDLLFFVFLSIGGRPSDGVLVGPP